MFYNGLTYFSNGYIYLTFIYNFCNCVSGCSFNITVNYLVLNDSLAYLNIISSSIYSTLFFLICVGFQIITNVQKSPVVLILSLITYNYYFNIEYINTLSNTVLTSTGLTTTLQNGLLNIHPYIVYIMYSYIFMYIRQMFVKYDVFSTMVTTFNTNINKLFFIILGIVLGGWWAAQEFNWGGFWSWDPVELISILICFYMLVLSHQTFSPFKPVFLIQFIFSTTIIYFIMRLGVVTTVHSFLKTTTVSFFAYILFFIVLLFLMYTYYLVLRKFCMCKQTKKIDINNYFITLIISLLATFSVLILNSFSNLLWYITPTLDFLYFFGLLFLLSIIYIDTINITKVLMYLIIVMLTLFSVNVTILIVVLFVVFYFFLKKTWWDLHFFILWVYVLGFFFFTTLLQYCKPYENLTYIYTVTDYYIYTTVNNLFLMSNTIVKSLFMFWEKNLLNNTLGFNSYSNVMIAQFLSIRGKTLNLTYSDVFIYLTVYILIAVYMMFYKRFYKIIFYY